MKRQIFVIENGKVLGVIKISFDRTWEGEVRMFLQLTDEILDNKISENSFGCFANTDCEFHHFVLVIFVVISVFDFKNDSKGRSWNVWLKSSGNVEPWHSWCVVEENIREIRHECWFYVGLKRVKVNNTELKLKVISEIVVRIFFFSKTLTAISNWRKLSPMRPKSFMLYDSSFNLQCQGFGWAERPKWGMIARKIDSWKWRPIKLFRHFQRRAFSWCFRQFFFLCAQYFWFLYFTRL